MISRLTILVAVIAVIGCQKPADQKNANPSAYEGAVVDPPLQKPDFTLTNVADGKPYDFKKETDGYVTLLFFGYTNCPDVCPVHMMNLSTVLQQSSYEVRSKVKTVVITVDPERDTPEKLKAWLAKYDKSFIGLRGTDSQVVAIEKALNLAPAVQTPNARDPKSYDVGHAAQIIAFTRSGKEKVVYPFGTRQKTWAHDLPLLVADSTP